MPKLTLGAEVHRLVPKLFRAEVIRAEHRLPLSRDPFVTVCWKFDFWVYFSVNACVKFWNFDFPFVFDHRWMSISHWSLVDLSASTSRFRIRLYQNEFDWILISSISTKFLTAINHYQTFLQFLVPLGVRGSVKWWMVYQLKWKSRCQIEGSREKKWWSLFQKMFMLWSK